MTLDRFVNSSLIYGDAITLTDTSFAGCEKDGIHQVHIGAARANRKGTGCSIGVHMQNGHVWKMWNSGIVSVLYRGSLYVLGGSFRIDHELADGNSTEPDESRAGKCSYSIHPDTQRVQSRFSCREKECSSVAMQFQLPGTFRYMMPPHVQ